MPCQIIKIVETQVWFLKPSGYCTVINCPFIFYTTNVFQCFSSVMVQFVFVKYKFLNLTILHSQYGFQITCGVKQCTCQCTNYHNTTNHYFGHVIYIPQTSTYQNIAKLLTHPIIFIYWRLTFTFSVSLTAYCMKKHWMISGEMKDLVLLLSKKKINHLHPEFYKKNRTVWICSNIKICMKLLYKSVKICIFLKRDLDIFHLE